jgi:hypothetical protein
MDTPLGTSLNVEPKLKAPRKLKLKSKESDETGK